MQTVQYWWLVSSFITSLLNITHAVSALKAPMKNDMLLSQTPSSSADDMCDRSELMLVATLGGELHALNSLNGAVVWSIQDPWGPLVKTSSSNHTRTEMDEPMEEWDQEHAVIEPDVQKGYELFIPEPMGDGQLYQLLPDNKLPLSIKKIVEKYPVYVSDDLVYTSQKSNKLIALNPSTGKVLRVYGGEDAVAPNEEAFKTHRVIFLGRTEYKVEIRQSRQKWNITYSEFTLSHPDSFFLKDPYYDPYKDTAVDISIGMDGRFRYKNKLEQTSWNHRFKSPASSAFRIVKHPQLKPKYALFKIFPSHAKNEFERQQSRRVQLLQQTTDSYIGRVGDSFYTLPLYHFELEYQPRIDSIVESERAPAFALLPLDDQHQAVMAKRLPDSGTTVIPDDIVVARDLREDTIIRLLTACPIDSPNYPTCLDRVFTIDPPPQASDNVNAAWDIRSWTGSSLIVSLLITMTLVVASTWMIAKRSVGSNRSVQEKGVTAETIVKTDDMANTENTGITETPTTEITSTVIQSANDIEQEVLHSIQLSDEILGFGSHGTVVYRGTFLNRPVAVKRLLLDFYSIAENEVKLLQDSDHHPNVIRYFFQETTSRFMYIALELSPASLHDVIENKNSSRHLALKSKLKWKVVMQMILRGLSHLHHLNIVHRDIKPQNILVEGGFDQDEQETRKQSSKRKPDRHPRIFISDFGFCKKLADDQSSFHHTLALGGNGGGTAGWRAPEILVGLNNLKEQDKRERTEQLDKEFQELERNRPQNKRNSSKKADHHPSEQVDILQEQEPTQASITTVETDDSTLLSPSHPSLKVTKKIDIFSAGCVFYYLLSNGEHPFGDRYVREMNIMKGNYKLERCGGSDEETNQVQDLIKRMITKDPKKRPDADTLMSHPYFWTRAQQLSFLQDVSDRFEKEEKDPPSSLLKQLERGAQKVVGTDWHRKVDRSFIDHLGKFRKYEGHKIVDLLRAIRNKKHHYAELPPAIQRALGTLPDGFLGYFTTRFPHLFMHVYYVVLNHPTLVQDELLGHYFKYTVQSQMDDRIGLHKPDPTIPSSNATNVSSTTLLTTNMKRSYGSVTVIFIEMFKRKSLASPSKHTFKKAKSSHACFESCKSLWSHMVDTYDSETLRHLTDIFMDLPDKKLYPDYYKIIQHPISFNTILDKLETYASLEEMVQDLEMMLNNAKQYNAAGSVVYEDATVLQKKLKAKLKSLQTQPTLKLVQKSEERPIIKIKNMDSDSISLLKSVISGSTSGLKSAIQSNSFAVNQLLSDASSGNDTKWSMLHAAAFHNNIEAVKLLLEAGADVESRDSVYQGTPLGWAAYKLNRDICALLLEHGADVNAKNVHQQTPLDLVDPSVRSLPMRQKTQPVTSKFLKLTVKLSSAPVQESQEQLEDEGLDVEQADEQLSSNQPSEMQEEEVIEVEAVVEPSQDGNEDNQPAKPPAPHYATRQQDLDADSQAAPLPPAIKLLTSIGIVSNENLIRKVIPSTVFAHCLQVDPSIRNLNLRLLLVQGAKSRCVLKHNGRLLKMTGGGTGEVTHIMDFAASLSNGVNCFEVLVMGGEYGLYNESYALFINKMPTLTT